MKINLAKKIQTADWVIFLIVAGITTIGIVALFGSAIGSNNFHAVIRQSIWLGISIFGMVFVFLLNKRVVFESAYFLYVFFLIMLVLVWIFGTTAGGSQRWIHLFGFSLQPSEFMKIAVLLVLARYFSQTQKRFDRFRDLILPFGLVILPTIIVIQQPDLGTSLIYCGLFFPVLFWAGVPIANIFLIIAPILSLLAAFHIITFTIWMVLLVALLIFFKKSIREIIGHFIFNTLFGIITPILWNSLHPYQQKRVLALFNPDIDPHGAGYQVIQSKTAIGSGGLFGAGFGHGTQTNLKFLPRQNTDFIFSVIGEEWGFIGAMLLLVLIMVLLIRVISKSSRSYDPFSRLVLFGSAFLLFFHTWVNIAMTMGIMPVTGLPLPFVSYGGSFLLTCFLLIGLVLNCSAED